MKIKWKFTFISTLIVAIVIVSILYFVDYSTQVSFERAFKTYHELKGMGFQFRKKFFDNFRISLILGGTVGVFFSFVLSMFFSKFIEGPIKKLRNALNMVAEGNFNVKIEPQSKDEIGELVKDFNYMVEKLRNLDDIRRDLVLQVTHEISTPLTSIMGYLEAIEDGIIKGKEKEEALKTIKKELNRLSELVSEVRDFSSIESLNFKLNKEWFNLCEEVDETIKMIKRKWKDKEIEVYLNCSEKEGFKVFLDKKRIRQILLNLLDNAFKFSKDGGRVEIEVKKEKNRNVIVIKDQGKGIPKEELNRIFEKFYRVKDIIKSGFEGTGFGLYIVKKLVEAHNGYIEIKSEKNKGTEVIVSFP